MLTRGQPDAEQLELVRIRAVRAKLTAEADLTPGKLEHFATVGGIARVICRHQAPAGIATALGAVARAI